jgi:hypothetical protein
MPRERRDFVRPSGFRDATLFIIACEGAETEPRYFNGLKGKLHSPRVHVEVLERAHPGHSAPDAVLAMLDSFAADWRLDEGDQLWLVIDRDPQSWKPKMLNAVVRECAQKGHRVAVSNPCFEVWLLVHFEDLAHADAGRRNQLLANADGLLKHAVASHLDPSLEYIDNFFPHTATAIARSRALDDRPRLRWPNGLGSRVYVLVEALMQFLAPPGP